MRTPKATDQSGSSTSSPDSVGSKESLVPAISLSAEDLANLMKSMATSKDNKGPTLKSIKRTIPGFDGTTDVAMWLQALERTAQEQGWTDQLVQKATLLLTGHRGTERCITMNLRVLN